MAVTGVILASLSIGLKLVKCCADGEGDLTRVVLDDETLTSSLTIRIDFDFGFLLKNNFMVKSASGAFTA